MSDETNSDRTDEKPIPKERRSWLRVSLIDISVVLNLVVAVSIALGAIFAVIQLREIGRDRRTQLVITLYSQFMSDLAEPYSKLIREDFVDIADMEKKCSYEGLVKVAAYYEGVGFMVRKGLVDERLVIELLPIHDVWEKMKPWVSQYREKTGGSLYWRDFEYLANRNKELGYGERVSIS